VEISGVILRRDPTIKHRLRRCVCYISINPTITFSESRSMELEQTILSSS